MASRSSRRESRENALTSRSERPNPLGSNLTTVYLSARSLNTGPLGGESHTSCTWLSEISPATTRGGPFPTVVKAILIPSLVLAYWMRGSMAGVLYAMRAEMRRWSQSGGTV